MGWERRNKDVGHSILEPCGLQCIPQLLEDLQGRIHRANIAIKVLSQLGPSLGSMGAVVLERVENRIKAIPAAVIGFDIVTSTVVNK